MSTKLPLGDFFARDVIRRDAKKRLFGGGYNVPLFTVAEATQLCFQKGALLGAARAGQFTSVCTLVAQPKEEERVASFLRNQANKLWNQYGNATDTLWEYCFAIEFSDMYTDLPSFISLLSGKKARLGKVMHRFEIATADGLGFGAAQPNAFRAMWERTWGGTPSESWTRAVNAGLNIPVKPESWPIDEATRSALNETAQYVKQHHPQLMTSLGFD